MKVAFRVFCDNGLMKENALGIASALVGASLWGVSATCSQFLLENYAISTLFITMVRLVVSAALFLLVIAWRYRPAIAQIAHDAKARRRLVMFGLLGLFASQITYLVAIGYTNGGTATVLQSTSIVMIMIATCITSRRRPKVMELAGLVLALAGTLLIATQGDVSSINLPVAGLVWGLASAVAVTCYTMLARPLFPRWGSFAVVGLGMAVGAIAGVLLWMVAFAVSGIDVLVNGGNAVGTALVPSLDAAGVVALLAIAVVGTFGAFYLYLNGVSMVGSVRGSQLGAIEPVSATVCSAVFMGTAFSVPDWIGLALMVATILLVAAGGNTPSRRSEEGR
jgi:drug/metabolite transporter (DMT)-like permease